MNFLSYNLALNVVGLATGIATDAKNVAIYDGTKQVLTGNIIFASSILSCNVVDDSKMCEHPIESGAVITDHKIFTPTEIDIRLAMRINNYVSTYTDLLKIDDTDYNIYRELLQIYENNTKLRIKTKTGWHNNMVLQAMPHEEKPENFDMVVFDLHFKEVMEIEPKYIKLQISQLKNAENSTTKKVGINNTNNTKKTSILKQGVNGIKGLFS